MTTEQIPRLRQMLKLQAYKFGALSAEAAKAYYDLGEGYSQADDFDNAEANLTKACDLYERLGMSEPRDLAKQLLEDIKFYRTGDVEEGNIEQLTLSHFNVPVYVRENGGESEKPTSYVEDVKAYFTEEMEKPVVANIAAVSPTASFAPPASSQPVDLSPEEKIKQREMKALDEAITNARMEASRLKRKGSRNTSQLADLLVDLAALHSKRTNRI